MNKEVNLKLLQKISKIASKYNEEVYIIGGFVRDLYLFEDSISNDIDLLVKSNANKIIKDIQTDIGGTLKEYPEFLTNKLILEKEDIEIDIAEYRSETYEKSGSMPVVKNASLIEDSKRRDFSVNTLMLKVVDVISIINDSYDKDKIESLIIDNLSSLEDLKLRKISVLHEKSFYEDPTRIFRAFRYKNLVGGEFSDRTLSLIKEAIEKNYIININNYRILSELKKISVSDFYMNTLIDLNNYGLLRQLLNRDWSKKDFKILKSLKPTFVPSFDLEKADMFSADMFSYAKKTKKNPKSLTDDIKMDLPEDAPFSAFIEEGYINLRLKKLNFANIDKVTKGSSTSVFLPHPSLINKPINSFVKIYSLAFVQFYMNLSQGNKSTIYFVLDGKCQAVNSIDGYIEYFNKINFDEKICEKKFIETLLENISIHESYVLFLCQNSLSKKVFNELHNKLSDNVKIVAPPNTVLEGYSYSLISEISKMNKEEFVNSMFYLAKNIKGKDSDLYEAILPQKNNLFWYLDTINSRLQKLSCNSIGIDIELSSSNSIRKLLLRAKYLNYFASSAMKNGLVMEFLTVLYEFLDEFLKYFNNPDFRRRLSEDSLLSIEEEILYGAKIAISDITYIR